MQPIYKKSLISFINTNTEENIVHPEGDYNELNIKLKRLEHLVDKYQPEQPIVFYYKPPTENTDIKHQFQPLGGLFTPQAMYMTFPMQNGVPNNASITPSAKKNLSNHVFITPAIGNNPKMTSMVKLENFNEFTTHVKELEMLVDNAISRLELTYDDHPLHYNKQVEFRSAKYIDNRQAFSFWPVSKPFGAYPLTKPYFDNSITQLNSINKDYFICVDFVQDWKEQYSSFDGPPKSYGIEVAVLFEEKQLPTIFIECDAKTLELCQKDHNLLDKLLQPAFESLSENIPNWYQSMVSVKKRKI